MMTRRRLLPGTVPVARGATENSRSPAHVCPNDKVLRVHAGDRTLSSRTKTNLHGYARRRVHPRAWSLRLRPCRAKGRGGSQALPSEPSRTPPICVRWPTVASASRGALENVKREALRDDPDCPIVAVSGSTEARQFVVQATEPTPRTCFLALHRGARNDPAGALVQSSALQRDPLRGVRVTPDYHELSVRADRRDLPVGRYPASDVARRPHPGSWPTLRDETTNARSRRLLRPLITSGHPPEQSALQSRRRWEVTAADRRRNIRRSSLDRHDGCVHAAVSSFDRRRQTRSTARTATPSGRSVRRHSARRALRQSTRVRSIEGFSSEGSPGNTMFGLTHGRRAPRARRGAGVRRRLWRAAIPPTFVHLRRSPS